MMTDMSQDLIGYTYTPTENPEVFYFSPEPIRVRVY